MEAKDVLLGPLKLLSNRVNRSYQGGVLLEQWQGKANASDSLQPEEWVASLVPARNSNFIENEGLSQVDTSNGNLLLIDLIKQNPYGFLGQHHVEKYGPNLAVLTKVLDASVRLSIQVHPTKAYSRQFFKSEFGKTEAWYILGGREINGEPPHVFAGFKPGINKEIWKKYFDEQDIDGMIQALHKYYVQPGDVVLIEGGLPHAIGSGCFLIEIQEPTDYTMRVEKIAFDGSTLPDMLCHQGVGFDNMLDCFSYYTFSASDLYNQCFKKPQVLLEQGDNSIVSLISEKHTPCFQMDKLVVNTNLIVKDSSFKTCIVVSGNGSIEWNGYDIQLKQGDMLFLPANIGEIGFANSGLQPLECLLSYPPGANK
ncbi:type I phosphomannose isomerase catalytic subunit [Parasediminibacterium sp. JCM 36343]|uniref:type I phosphomannose isomerase catalytic subunit n=1 Tax=Parasediminibacterium sp. JCM 36343 TaxID=3374279 RepID=UPI00397BE02C